MTRDGDAQNARLLAEWHGGSRAALEELVRRNLGWLRDYVRNRLGDKLRGAGETQDFVQDAVIDVLTNGPRFAISNSNHFRAVLGKIVENNLRDRARWQGRECRNPDRVRSLPTDTVLQLDPAARSVTRPSQVAVREERRAWIRLAIDLLEAKDRDVIWMRDWERMTFPEIAEQLGINANAAHLRYRHALPRLAQKVKQLHGGRLGQAVESG